MRYFFLLFITLSLFAEEIETQDMNFRYGGGPWFTGPLLAPSARVVHPGHLKFQIYAETNVKIGRYESNWHTHSIENFYSEEIVVQLKLGLFDRVDFQVTSRAGYRHTEGQSAYTFGDLPLNLNVQILQPVSIDEGPNLKLSLLANAPTGKFQHLNQHKKKTDASGSGCWFPGIGLDLSQFWYFSGIHYLELRASGAYRFGVPVHVKSFNTYGGNERTKGTVYPGNFFVLDTALQYSITQRWGASCDFLYEHFNRTRYSGRGLASRERSGEEFSLAPAIEYNFTKEMGVIGGVWFTIAGRNVSQFVNGIVSFGAYF